MNIVVRWIVAGLMAAASVGAMPASAQKAATFLPVDKQIALSRMHADGLSNLAANREYSILERTELQPATDTLTIERVLVAV